MNALYNSKVVKMQYCTRAMQSSGKGISGGIIPHAGILLTLQNGDTHLVHIVPNSKAVITSSSNMSNEWSYHQSKGVNTTVGKVMAVAEGMGEYNYLPVNCITVANKIYDNF